MTTADFDQTGIADAIQAAGSQKQLAAIIGCTQQHISFWKKQGFVTAERIIEVEQATGVPRARLIDPKLVDLLSTMN